MKQPLLLLVLLTFLCSSFDYPAFGTGIFEEETSSLIMEETDNTNENDEQTASFCPINFEVTPTHPFCGVRGKIAINVTVGQGPYHIEWYNDAGSISSRATTTNKNVLIEDLPRGCLLYTSPSPRDLSTSRMPSSA